MIKRNIRNREVFQHEMGLREVNNRKSILCRDLEYTKPLLMSISLALSLTYFTSLFLGFLYSAEVWFHWIMIINVFVWSIYGILKATKQVFEI